VFTIKKRMAAVAGAVLVGAGLVASGAAPVQASAFDGGHVSAGSEVCTIRLQSDRGVAFYGSLNNVGATQGLWTVYASTTASGSETRLIQLAGKSPSNTYVSWPGTFYYRLCVKNNGTVASFLKISFYRQSGATVNGTAGAYSMILGSGSYNCLGSTSVAAKLTGTSSVAVRWTANVFNFNADGLRTEDYGASTTVNQAVAPGDDEIFTACVQNTSASTATLSYTIE
jgi:hypothetical protein